MKSAIIYCGKTGFTEKCVNILKEKLNGEVDICDIRNSTLQNLEKYDTVIIGSGIYIGKIPTEMKKIIKNNLNEILKKNIVLFITAGENRSEYMTNNFPKEILDKAVIKEYFGAGMDTKRLSFVEKMLLKIIGKCKDFSNINSNAIERVAKAFNSIK